jgi:hypothetical protein
MDPLWLLKGPHEAPGWKALQQDARADAIDVLLFDRDAWALVRAPAPPTGYEGLGPTTPPAGLYLDQQGRPAYVADGQLVPNARAVIATLGPDAQDLLTKLGDPELTLERLGRAY